MPSSTGQMLAKAPSTAGRAGGAGRGWKEGKQLLWELLMSSE